MPEYFARLREWSACLDQIPNDAVTVCVGQRTNHIIRQNTTSQAKLQGVGLADLRLTLPETTDGKWAYNEALAFCENGLSDLSNMPDEELSKKIALELVETLEGAELGPIVRTPTGAISQLVVLPPDVWKSLIADAESDVGCYLTAREIGFSQMEHRIFDNQPDGFRDWFGAILLGKKTAPKKRPKAWLTAYRDLRFINILLLLERHGIHPTRHENQIPESGCDIVSRCAVSLGMPGARTYDGVLRIWKGYRKSLKARSG